MMDREPHKSLALWPLVACEISIFGIAFMVGFVMFGVLQ